MPQSTVHVRGVVRLAVALVLAGGIVVAGTPSTIYSAAVRTPAATSPSLNAFHASTFVVDLHADTVQDLESGERTLGARSGRGHVDLPRLREGGVDVQVFAIFVPPTAGSSARSRSYRLIRTLRRQIMSSHGGAHGGMVLATTVSAIQRAAREGKIASVLSIENGDPLAGDLAALDGFYAAGVRMMSLTWNASNALGDGASGDLHGGLTEFGRRVLRRMNTLGIVVDVSHLSEASFWDALKVTRGPVIASHSNASSVHPHARNLTDDQLRAIARRGGVVGVTFVPRFLGGATLAHVLKHIDHMVRVMGADHVAIGSDFDGFRRPPDGLEDASHLPNLTAGLVWRGYSEDAIRKIMGGNAMRVFRTIWGR
jgi:membrane dipeptidase